ncbi:MAG: hypothetical protein Tp185DCM00d2C31949991_20 [Prokaryotic dsDNA virus sp.]|nr:MAG: hypothetical protein Tp162SUR1511541_66 [Prokaryotic dsDNA virus sp.]QDP56732.1 MAG: hypothetical protein Tp185DCM00d2C31949991_20 [Prokaryotic dsDNA virus sp.]QDP63750.1 MAG: hypothetical protein Unbinned2480contig1002_4 [Prokaryotic dsDNA virus sp.]QDP63836.1 MAG: hypothetical protein GOVbin2429_20 [Prokaryotic dsDNA virus sp.]|tara:strand:+ start:41170 stop:41337 length:168 start_codon:yes stop_codon:yes gene_type:complete
MAKMLKDVYCLVDGKTALIKTGEDAPKGDSEKLVKKGYAVDVEVKAETKKPATKK